MLKETIHPWEFSSVCVPGFDLLKVAASAAPGSMWLFPREETSFSASSPKVLHRGLCAPLIHGAFCVRSGDVSELGEVILPVGTGLAVHVHMCT